MGFSRGAGVVHCCVCALNQLYIFQHGGAVLSELKFKEACFFGMHPTQRGASDDGNGAAQIDFNKQEKKTKSDKNSYSISII